MPALPSDVEVCAAEASRNNSGVRTNSDRSAELRRNMMLILAFAGGHARRLQPPHVMALDRSVKALRHPGTRSSKSTPVANVLRAFPGRTAETAVLQIRKIRIQDKRSFRRTRPSAHAKRFRFSLPTPYQPRVCSMWASSSALMARPFMAPPRSSLTSSNTLGS